MAKARPRDADAEGSKQLDARWLEWLALRFLEGYSDGSILKVMVGEGIDRAEAVTRLARVKASPFVAAGQTVAKRLGKRNAFLEIRRTLAAQDPGNLQVERRKHIEPDRFFKDYYFRNRPVILLDMIESWPAFSRWRPEYFREHFGHVPIEVQMDREQDPEYEINSPDHKRELGFGEFVDMVLDRGKSNDFYLVANNFFFKRPDVEPLLLEVGELPGILDPGAMKGKINLWFGPAGTVTPLHHDIMNLMVAQLFGRKRVRLFPAWDIHLLYNHIGVFSEADPEHPDPGRFPYLDRATMFDIELAPGELLFIPVGWWHHVRALEISITLSFSNFTVPNEYSWEF